MPEEVWKHFFALTRTPRPSGKEAAVRELIAGFGTALGLAATVDPAGNLIISKPATAGMERRKGVILQAHLDMVPQKNSGTIHDFERDPIDAFVEGGWVRANGTTLGADNGMGVAAAMAVLGSSSLRHGPLEALFTVDEERGMSGAMGLTPGMLRGEILLNMDSEDEGELFIGCAGAVNATTIFRYSRQLLPYGYEGFAIAVTGLRGGHSGMDIELGRGNANKIMNRILYHGHRSSGVLVASIEGGSLRNAIPRESVAHVAIPSDSVGEFLGRLRVWSSEIKHELALDEPDLNIEAHPVRVAEWVIEEGVLISFLRAIYACPNGVMRMSSDMKGLVETSNNLAIVRTDNGRITVENLLRSSVDSARDDLQSMMQSLFDLAGAESVFDGSYPGWKPELDASILKVMRQAYQRKFGPVPETRAVHAGLECGIIGGIYPGLEMISFGPTIRHPHSPDERVEIASVQRFWEFLVETLEHIPER